jgi:hypothetical protein
VENDEKMSPHETSENIAEKRAAVISTMISSLRRGEDRQYFVGLVGYYIEGIQYSASGLSMNLTAAQDIRETSAGFACTAIFPPNLLEPSTVKANGIVKINVGGQITDAVRVRLEVMLDDIWSVAEFVDGTQHDLFFDLETFNSRLAEFPVETH